MALRQIEYGGMVITAGAFEVVGTGRFFAVLSIARPVRRGTQHNSKLFHPAEGLFNDTEGALDAAVEFGRAIVDGTALG